MKVITSAIYLSDKIESLNKSLSKSIDKVNTGMQELLKQLNEEEKHCEVCGGKMVKKPG